MSMGNIPPNTPNLAASQDPVLYAAPLIGMIIIGFATLETAMRDMMIAVRIRNAVQARKAPDVNLPRKTNDRANEWIRTVLPASCRQSEGDTFRKRFQSVKVVRDNLAHNIDSIELTDAGKLLVLTVNLDRPHEWSESWTQQSMKLNPNGPYTGMYPMTLYDQSELVAFGKEIKACLMFVQEVHRADSLHGSPPLPTP